MRRPPGYIFILVAILLLNGLFRFYRNGELQYWTNDEEDISGVVQRMIINRRPTLVSPHPNLGSSIGSLFPIVSVPLFLLTSNDPQKVLALTSGLSFFTTLVLFWIGKIIKDVRLGLIIAFLYASSFFASIYDRRWWTLSLNPLLASLSLLCLIRLVSTRQSYLLLPLAVITGLAVHGDASILAITLVTIFIIVLYQIKPRLSHLALSLAIVGLFISPLVAFELRHPGSILKPLLITINRKHEAGVSFSLPSPLETLKLGQDTFQRLLYPQPSQFLETSFSQQLLSNSQITISFIAVMAFMIFPLLALIFSHRLNSSERHGLSIIYLFLSTFYLGLFLFGYIYKIPAQRFYFTLLFPIMFTLSGYTIYRLSTGRKWVLWIILPAYLLLNLIALNFGSLRYPLALKSQVVTAAITQLGPADFSLYVFGDPFLESGGITRLFTLQNKVPKKSYIYGPLDWIYKAHSLYFTQPSDKDQNRVVIIVPVSAVLAHQSHLIYELRLRTIKLAILDNTSHWFDPSQL